jgi:predicted nucleic acid-binding protein
LLKRLSDEGRLVFSAQVFNEFGSAMMGPRRKKPLRPDEVAVILRELEATGEVVPITTSLTFRGLDAMPRHGLSFWDALIWATAAENQIGVIYTEDFQAGRKIEGVWFVDPFLPESSTTN